MSDGRFVGIHCSPRSLGDDPFYGKIIDEYHHAFRQVLEAVQRDYPRARPLLKQVDSFGSLSLDDDSVDLVFEIEQFFEDNYLEWIFVSEKGPMTKYGSNCYRVYFKSMRGVYPVTDEMTEHAMIYVYNSKTSRPTLKNDDTLENEGIKSYAQFVLEDLSAGGLADDLAPEDIAKKHGVPVEDIEAQIEKGTKVELEHTDDEDLAREIAMDHLFELPDYYDRLADLEKEAEKTDESFKNTFDVDPEWWDKWNDQFGDEFDVDHDELDDVFTVKKKGEDEVVMQYDRGRGKVYTDHPLDLLDT